ncbi:MAG: hypothetical protein KDD94_03920, partial [Calditrichaeota bacterium]|nr:hypothetical protein [Calditrichota bacterium]
RGNELIVHQLQSSDAKYLYGKIDRDGNFTDLVENKNYVDQVNDDRFFTNLIDYLFTPDGIYTKDQKTYKFFYHDLNYKLLTT